MIIFCLQVRYMLQKTRKILNLSFARNIEVKLSAAQEVNSSMHARLLDHFFFLLYSTVRAWLHFHKEPQNSWNHIDHKSHLEKYLRSHVKGATIYEREHGSTCFAFCLPLRPTWAERQIFNDLHLAEPCLGSRTKRTGCSLPHSKQTLSFRAALSRALWTHNFRRSFKSWIIRRDPFISLVIGHEHLSNGASKLQEKTTPKHKRPVIFIDFS